MNGASPPFMARRVPVTWAAAAHSSRTEPPAHAAWGRAGMVGSPFPSPLPPQILPGPTWNHPT